MKKIYAFDFDGTLTSADSLPLFLRFACGTPRFLLGMLLFSPLIALAMLRLYDNGRAKERLLGWFFRGMREDEFNDICLRFANEYGCILRPAAVETIEKVQSEGGEVLIVSASPEKWVQPFFPAVRVLGTQLEIKDGLLTGRFQGKNCHGQEKVSRLLAVYPHRDTYHLTAYGDSGGDRELLRLADEAHYKPFRPDTIPLSPKIHRNEWPVALSVTLWVAVLNLLMLLKYYGVLFPEGEGCDTRNFHLSGFDAITYRVLTDWGPYYDVVRHPLLHWLLYPVYLLNQGLWGLTGLNCAMPLTCLLLVACACYSSVLFYRIARYVVRVGHDDAMLLTWLFFSFAYVMTTFVAPDHFALSLVLLFILLCGSEGKKDGWLFLLTAGVTLTNGAKAVLAMLFTRGRRFWRPRYLLLSLVLPTLLVLGAAWVQHRLFVLPQEQAREQYEKTHRTEIIRQARANHKKYKNAPWVIHKGRPIGYGTPKEGNELSQSLLRWTDVTTPRWDTTVENLLGESIQFHETHMLEDVLVYYRPVLLEYENWWHYLVEGLLVILFLSGCWLGWRSRLLWLLLCWLAIDMTMHIGLGFAINEVYIMSAHWIFIIPLMMGFLFTPRQPSWMLKSARILVSLLTLYLIIYNGWQLIDWMLQPIVPPPFNV